MLADLDRYMQKNESQPPTYTTKINSKLKKDLNISCDTIKALEKNISRKISDIPCSNIFTDMSLKARDRKERINKWDLMKLKSFCMTKEHTEGPETHEKMLSISSHQRDEN